MKEMSLKDESSAAPTTCMLLLSHLPTFHGVPLLSLSTHWSLTEVSFAALALQRHL